MMAAETEVGKVCPPQFAGQLGGARPQEQGIADSPDDELEVGKVCPPQVFSHGGARPQEQGFADLVGDANEFQVEQVVPPEIGQVQRRDIIAPKAKAPVLQNTFGKAVATPTESGVLSRPDFLGVSTFGRAYGFGRGGACPQGWPHGFTRVLNHHVHPLCFKTQRVVPESRKGAKTMTVSTLASRCAAPITQATTEEARAFALLQATSDATMAKLYLSRGNVAAARRKAVQLLKALQLLEVAV